MDKRFSVFDVALAPSRRDFLRVFSAGAAGSAFAAVMGSGSAHASRFGATSKTSAVALTTGTDRRGMVYDALKPFKDEVRAGIKNRQAVIKVNMGQVDAKLPLNATHPDAVRGILDFLKPIYKHRVILAEATAAESRSTLEGFKNFGFLPL